MNEDEKDEVSPKGSPAQEGQGEHTETWKDQFLRLSADFQNYRRRVEKERASWILEGGKKIITTFLPIIDELDRALKSSEKYERTHEMEVWLEGFAMIKHNLERRLREIGVEDIDCTGSFDPNLHEALMHVDAPGHQSGEILEVFTRGYTFHGTVVRYAQVGVAQ